MTSDRDQLAELIHDAVYSGAQRVNWEDIADAILAAGWRPPKPHVHDWHQTENYTWCSCGATAKQHYGVWVTTERGRYEDSDAIDGLD